ncbi:unnamed protein product [Angiostrongylus costaricensis]|uniref:Histone H4 n=1 Tax=Angiostrongylus costaricensis TaxID=334426 RepID=A0A0R3PZ20_ANGCS|nr:unnamed protein product [Angiostrongylus costaricensis]
MVFHSRASGFPNKKQLTFSFGYRLGAQREDPKRSTTIGVHFTVLSHDCCLQSCDWEHFWAPKGGKGQVKGGVKRYREVLGNIMQEITKQAIHHLARRAAVMRTIGLVCDEIRELLNVFLENVIRDDMSYCVQAMVKP